MAYSTPGIPVKVNPVNALPSPKSCHEKKNDDDDAPPAASASNSCAKPALPMRHARRATTMALAVVLVALLLLLLPATLDLEFAEDEAECESCVLPSPFPFHKTP